MCTHRYPAYLICKHWQRETRNGVEQDLPVDIARCRVARWGSDKTPCGEACPDPDRRRRGEDWSWEATFRPGAPDFCRGCAATLATASGDVLLGAEVLLVDLGGVLVHDWRVRHRPALLPAGDVRRMEREARAVVDGYRARTWDGPRNTAGGYLRAAHAAFRRRWDAELARREREAREARAARDWRDVVAAVNPRLNNEVEGAIETPMPGLPPWGSHSPRFPTYDAYSAYHGTGEAGESSSSPPYSSSQAHDRQQGSSPSRSQHHRHRRR